jgi:hypothetical protein
VAAARAATGAKRVGNGRTFAPGANRILLIGETFDLDAIAEDCANDGIYEFLFLAAPLPFTAAVGSTVNPLVVK